MRILFYELPPGDQWQGTARLISFLYSDDPIAVILQTAVDRKQLAAQLWNLPPSMLIPHGIHGESADEQIDPVIMYPDPTLTDRPILIPITYVPLTDLGIRTMIAEPVSPSDRDKSQRRTRFRAYREAGYHPSFVSWREWGGSESGAG